MSDERGAEITSDVPIIHYCDRWIALGRQDAGERRQYSGPVCRRLDGFSREDRPNLKGFPSLCLIFAKAKFCDYLCC